MKTLKYLKLIAILLVGAMTFVACSDDDDKDEKPEKPEVPDTPEVPKDETNVTKFNTFTETVNGVSFKMIAVKGGTFMMGTDEDQSKGGWKNDDERPAHQVTLSDYFIGETEVTQELWEAVMGEGTNPSTWLSEDEWPMPVENVSWKDCQEFAKKLSELTGRTYRLPTEAEWEYAARGGNKSKGYLYSGTNDPRRSFWYYDTTSYPDPENYFLHHVGEHQPVGCSVTKNELAIYDMSGNVWEWCSDHYGSYPSEPQTNPTGSTKFLERVFRGGSYEYHEWFCRCTCRMFGKEDYSFNNLGLRIALPMKKIK